MTVPTAPNRVTSTPSLLWQPTPRHQTLGLLARQDLLKERRFR